MPPEAPADGTPDSRTKILDVAESLFARRGYAGVGLREVAQEVGLSKSSLFHHFPTKVALYQDVLARVLGRLDERFDRDLERTRRIDASSLAARGPWERVLDALAAQVLRLI